MFGDVAYDNSQFIANKFNEYFINSIIELNESIEHIEFNPNLVRACQNEMDFPLTDANEILHIAHNMNNKKDDSGISIKMLIDSFEVIGHKIVDICNMSL